MASQQLDTAPTREIHGPQGRRAAWSLVRERRGDPLGMFTRLRREYGPFVPFRMGPLHMYLLTDPDLVEEVFTTHAGSVRKGRMLEGARVVLGDGLLTAEGDTHRAHRRIVQPAFHSERLHGYGEVMARHTREAVDGWIDGEVVDVFSAMSGLTMAVVAETMFGWEVRDRRAAIESALVDVFRALDLLVLPIAGLRLRLPTRTVRRYRAAREELEGVVASIISARRADTGRHHDDLLSMLLTATDARGLLAYSDEDIRHEVMTFFAAGMETTANALTFTLHLLAGHPDAERRVREEVAALPGDPGFGDLERLTITTAVVQESLRLYPPAWMVARRSTAGITVGGHEVPDGALLMMPPYLIHREPAVWTDPERFLPERWERPPAHRYAFIPFGAGARKCIGANFAMVEAVVILGTLLRRVRLTGPEHTLDLSPQITLRPKHPVRLTVRRDAA